MSPQVKGFLLASVAAATYGMNPLFTLPLYSAGMSAQSVLLVRYLLAVPIVAIMILARKRSFRVSGRSIAPLVGVGLLMALSSLTLFVSYNYMDAGIASCMLFVYPVMVAAIMGIFFKEKIRATTILSLLFASGGIALMYHTSGSGKVSFIGTVIVMASTLSYALYIVAINQSRLRHVATLTLTFYVLVTGSLMFLAIALIDGFTPPAHAGALEWGCLIALAVLPTVVSFMCTTQAIQYIGSTPTAILGSLEPVTAVIIGVTVFGEVITERDFLGLLLIIAGVTMVVAGPDIPARLLRRARMRPHLRRKSK